MFRCLQRFVFGFALLLLGLAQYPLLRLGIVQAQEKSAEKKTAQSAPAQKADDCDISPIGELDVGIQLRFQQSDGNLSFGIRRALPQRERYHLYRMGNSRIGDYPSAFAPNSVQELMAVSQLEDAGWKVALYLVGRSILGEKPDKSLWDDPKSEYYARKPINNPILITGNFRADEWPSAWELWEESQKAMKAFGARNYYDFTWGTWTMAARPIRAGEQSCLQCHLGNEALGVRGYSGRGYSIIDLPADLEKAAKNGQARNSVQESKLKIGDTLGVALYAYKRQY